MYKFRCWVRGPDNCRPTTLRIRSGREHRLKRDVLGRERGIKKRTGEIRSETNQKPGGARIPGRMKVVNERAIEKFGPASPTPGGKPRGEIIFRRNFNRPNRRAAEYRRREGTLFVSSGFWKL